MSHDHPECERAPDFDGTLPPLAMACARCANEDQLQAIFHEHVQALLPHQGVLLLLGRRWQDQLRVEHAISIGYGERATRNAMAAERLADRKALQTWLADGKPLVVDLPNDAACISALEAKEIVELGLGRIAAHGLLDPNRMAGSYMTYSGVEAAWPKAQIAEVLQLITPPLHLAFVQALAHAQRQLPLPPVLSLTEQQLVRCLAQGLTNAEIARQRQRSVNTVRNQLTALFGKLGATNRAEALALARGLIL